MYPHERSLVNKLSDKPFALIGVNSDRDLDAIRETVQEKDITWRSFWNGEKGTGGPISTKWRVRGWPTIYVMDADGVIRYKNVRGEKLDEAIETLLAEMGHEVDLSAEPEPEEESGEDESGEKDAPEDKDADKKDAE